MNVLWQILICSGMTNIGLICFHLHPYKTWRPKDQYLLFFACTACLFVLSAGINFCYHDGSKMILAQRRQARQREVAFKYGMDRKGQQHEPAVVFLQYQPELSVES